MGIGCRSEVGCSLLVQQYIHQRLAAIGRQVKGQAFRAERLLQAGNEVTLALSVLATLVLLVPIIPIIYAVIVNAFCAASAFSVLLQNEKPGKGKKKE